MVPLTRLVVYPAATVAQTHCTFCVVRVRRRESEPPGTCPIIAAQSKFQDRERARESDNNKTHHLMMKIGLHFATM